ncbi:MAG: Nif3-like dinuclear metal center hexameric protein [Sedimenticola sp.]|uniref:Nif3-like dinuclear metal center hexameric protein n=1 Tax=Sedimenticola thiotaurini TaxID=1543721 RepID=A0A558DG59_9GAMM|nr:Nif3-like dinuclear metal center hexameric protein [Sedimenticola sp.]MCW8948625.1 Nif3-like dinuclear metal center hexameric protein [Sedimenticola sp.]MCW8975889.1 Nif3-like dinuclear metal center hexameric protein [Sedimenticola sp.]TVT59962.1 MAG: Nif3-like dinuclear metal center hexameric protein [Sedimenticola thiotaurini]
MIELLKLEQYCNELLGVARFDDYCPNGLQVDGGKPEIGHIASAVTASQAVIEAAIEQQADLLLVHHGYFWRGEPAPLTGIKGRRIRSLLHGGLSMMAYHLPLDAHPTLGNNYLLGERLGFVNAAPLDQGLVWQGELPEVTPEVLVDRIAQHLDRTPFLIRGHSRLVQSVGWCTGAAQNAISEAAAAGLDLFISGEISESTTHLARELGIHYIAAGHHATERYGVQALGEHLAKKFVLTHQFIDEFNPV